MASFSNFIIYSANKISGFIASSVYSTQKILLRYKDTIARYKERIMFYTTSLLHFIEFHLLLYILCNIDYVCSFILHLVSELQLHMVLP